MNTQNKQAEYKAKLIQKGVIVAQAESKNKEDVEREIQHYALMYSQDGEVEIKRSYKLWTPQTNKPNQE